MTDADGIGRAELDVSSVARASLAAEEIWLLAADAVGRYPFHRDPGVRGFLTRHIAERYRPAAREDAREHLDALAWLYHIGMTQLGRFGIAEEDPLAHVVVQRALACGENGTGESSPQITKWEQMRRMFETAYGWRAKPGVYDLLQDRYIQLPLLKPFGGHLLFDMRLPDFNAVVRRAGEIVEIHRQVSLWLVDLTTPPSGEAGIDAQRMRESLIVSVFHRAASEWETIAFDFERARRLVREEMERRKLGAFIEVQEGARCGAGGGEQPVVAHDAAVTTGSIANRLEQAGAEAVIEAVRRGR